MTHTHSLAGCFEGETCTASYLVVVTVCTAAFKRVVPSSTVCTAVSVKLTASPVVSSVESALAAAYACA